MQLVRSRILRLVLSLVLPAHWLDPGHFMPSLKLPRGNRVDSRTRCSRDELIIIREFLIEKEKKHYGRKTIRKI